MSQTRTQIAEREVAYAWLAKDKSAQDVAIIEHYARYARLAVELLDFVAQNRIHPTSELSSMIELITSDIRAAHAKELGIELEWRKVPQSIADAQELREIHWRVENAVKQTFSQDINGDVSAIKNEHYTDMVLRHEDDAECSRCGGEGRVPVREYDAVKGETWRTCPDCHGTTEGCSR